MPVVAVVHRGPAAGAALRRGLGRRGARVMACRSIEQVADLFQRDVVDAVVIDARTGATDAASHLHGLYPRIPIFALGEEGPDDAPVLQACRRAGLRGLP